MPDRIHFERLSRADDDSFAFSGRLEVDQPRHLMLAEAMNKPFILPLLDRHNPSRPIGKIEHFGNGLVSGSIFFCSVRPTMEFAAGYRIVRDPLNLQTAELLEISLLFKHDHEPEPAVPAEPKPDVSSDHNVDDGYLKLVRKREDGTLKTLCHVKVRPGEEITVTVDANAIAQVTF